MRAASSSSSTVRGDQIGEPGGFAVHEPQARAEGLRGEDILHPSVIHAQGVGPALLHEHLAVVAAAGQQGAQDRAQLFRGERGRCRRTPLAGAGGLPVGQQGLFRQAQRFVQIPAVVVEHPVGMQYLLGPRGLGADALHGLLVAEAVALHQAFEPGRLRRFHHPERIKNMRLPTLHPERRVQHHALDPGGQGGEPRGQPRFDARMQQRFQPGPLGRIGEHQPGQPGPVQAAVGVQDSRAEGRHQIGQSFGTRFHHVAGHLVGVDHHPFRGGQPDGGVGFPGGDATGQPDDGVGGLGQARVQASHSGKLQGGSKGMMVRRTGRCNAVFPRCRSRGFEQYAQV